MKARLLSVMVGLISLSCGYSRSLFLEATDPAATSIRKHFASQEEAHASIGRYVDAATELTRLAAQDTSHLDCLREYFCESSGRDDEPIRSDSTCYKALRRFDNAGIEAFGRYHSRWGGDVFGWVMYGDSGDPATEEAQLARMHLVDEYTVDQFTRLWAENEGNPIAIAVIRGYSGQRWSSCCREELTYFVWAHYMEAAFEQAAASWPDWDQLTVGCNGGREASQLRLGAAAGPNYGINPPTGIQRPLAARDGHSPAAGHAGHWADNMSALTGSWSTVPQ